MYEGYENPQHPGDALPLPHAPHTDMYRTPRGTATQGGTGATLYARLAEHRLHRRGEAILYRELRGSADSLATRLQREENLLPENDRKEPQRGSFRRGGVAQAA